MAVVPPDLAALSDQAASLLDRAKDLHARMEALPPGDPQRAELERVIRDLLNSANSISNVVQNNIPRP
jgi:hypothetical protein